MLPIKNRRKWSKRGDRYQNSHVITTSGFTGGLALKDPPANTGDVGLIPGSGRSLGEGNGNPL